MAETWGFLARLLNDICKEIGASIVVHDDFGRFGTIFYDNGKSVRFKGTSFDINGLGAYKIADDKDYTAKLLAASGLNAAEGRVVVSPSYRAKLASYSESVADGWDPVEDARSAFQAFGFPLFIKPNIGSEGIGVRKVASEHAAIQHLETLYQRCDTVLIQPPAKGRDFRLVMLDGDLCLAYERRPLSVTGNGKSTLSQLLDVRVQDLKASGRYLNLTTVLPLIHATLLTENLSFDEVPDTGCKIALLPNANLSTGGDAVDVTEQVDRRYVEVAQQAMDAVGLRFGGLDILACEISSYDVDHTILEINPSPGLQNFYAVSAEKRASIREVYLRLLLAMQTS